MDGTPLKELCQDLREPLRRMGPRHVVAALALVSTGVVLLALIVCNTALSMTRIAAGTGAEPQPESNAEDESVASTSPSVESSDEEPSPTNTAVKETADSGASATQTQELLRTAQQAIEALKDANRAWRDTLEEREEAARRRRIAQEARHREEVQQLEERLDGLARQLERQNEELARREAIDEGWQRAERIEGRAPRAARSQPKVFRFGEDGRARRDPFAAEGDAPGEPGHGDGGHPDDPFAAEPSQSAGEPAPSETDGHETSNLRSSRRTSPRVRRPGYVNVAPHVGGPSAGPPPGSASRRLAEQRLRREKWLQASRGYRNRDPALRQLDAIESGHR